MKVISFVTQKGGSGKTTLTTSLAPYLKSLKLKVLILDMDPQGTAEFWYNRREEEVPQLIKISSIDLDKTLSIARQKEFDLVLIDTPGKDEPGNLNAIRHSDFCIVPCRPTPADIKAVVPTVTAITRLTKPFCFVLTQVNARGNERAREAEIALETFGLVSPIRIVSRNTYQDAQGAGLAPNEYEEHGKAAEEIKTLWDWISNKMKKMCHE